jgi:hypothetical protein
MTTSFLIASGSNGFSEPDARKTALASVPSYRERMAEFAQMPALNVWYARLDLETILLSIKDQEAQKRLQRRVQKAEPSEVHEVDFSNLVTLEKRGNRGFGIIFPSSGAEIVHRRCFPYPWCVQAPPGGDCQTPCQSHQRPSRPDALKEWKYVSWSRLFLKCVRPPK